MHTSTYKEALVFMNAVFVRNYKLHQTLTFFQKKAYHHRKRHLTRVRCALITSFYSLYCKMTKIHWCTVFCHLCDLDIDISQENGIP